MAASLLGKRRHTGNPMDLPRYRIRLRDRVRHRDFWVEGRWYFWLEGRRYLLLGRDHAVRRFFKQLGSLLRQGSNSSLPILLALRQDFRAIEANRPIPGLVRCVADGDSDTRRLAIWLLGRIRNRCTTSVVAMYSRDRDIPVRKEVAKTLRRLEAWAELREIVTREYDPVVRRIAKLAEAPPREFSERMARFLGNDVEIVEQPDEVGPGAKSLHVNTTVGDGTPPKSRWYIRLILEHIRWLVGRQASKFSGKQAKPKA